MSRTPKPESGDAAIDKTPSGTATGKSRIEPVPLNLTVNGLARTITVEPRMTLLNALRENLALTGTKKACDRGECGACTVHIDGRRVLSCMTLAAMLEGKKITTIEALEKNGVLTRSMAFSIGTTDSMQLTPQARCVGVAMIEEAKPVTNRNRSGSTTPSPQIRHAKKFESEWRNRRCTLSTSLTPSWNSRESNAASVCAFETWRSSESDRSPCS
jgi:xanthine dehydrogenase YagT iron-sulfur-binding subunit